jgi:quinol monooxygenase YgiN
MYGLIGKVIAVPGKREELIEILLAGSAEVPGCQSYIVAKVAEDPNAVWVSEVWDSRESHQASLGLPQVFQAIEKGRPLISGFGERFETEPVERRIRRGKFHPS